MGAIEDLEQQARDLNADLVLEMAKSAADMAGIIDPTPTSDAISGAISLEQGEYFDAFLSGLSMIPYLGDVVAKPIKGLRLTKKILEIKEKLAAVIKKRDALKEAAEKAKKAEEVAEKAKKLPKDKVKKTTEDCPKPQKTNKVETEIKIPDGWIEQPSKKGGGKLYQDPKNTHNSIRQMPGNPNSPNVSQQKPYTIFKKNGVAYDANGKALKSADDPLAHIPSDNFDINKMPKFD
jgi:hypothetical protein